MTSDSLLLSNFIQLNGNEAILDVGCGSGLLSIELCQKYPSVKITAIDIQPELIVLAQQNAQQYHVANQCFFICDDFLKHHFTKKFDVIVSNPPYYATTAGLLSPNPSKNIAKHEITLTMQQLLLQSASLLMPGGFLYLIYPIIRKVELLKNTEPYFTVVKIQEHGFSPKKQRCLIKLQLTKAQLVISSNVIPVKTGIQTN